MGGGGWGVGGGGGGLSGDTFSRKKLDKTSKQSEFWACCAYNVGMLIKYTVNVYCEHAVHIMWVC